MRSLLTFFQSFVQGKEFSNCHRLSGGLNTLRVRQQVNGRNSIRNTEARLVDKLAQVLAPMLAMQDKQKEFQSFAQVCGRGGCQKSVPYKKKVFALQMGGGVSAGWGTGRDEHAKFSESSSPPSLFIASKPCPCGPSIAPHP